ncbi:MAG: alpha/beta fold hydrolase [Pseudomonadota bacterium]
MSLPDIKALSRRTALALLAAGAACGPRPLGTHERLGEVRVGSEGISGQGGTTLALSRWAPAGRPRAMILALHGYGDTARTTYARAARSWADAGILTYAYDHRGFGENPTRRQWPGAEVLSADAVAVANALRARHPGLPQTVVGHSMGGGVALAAAGEGLQADALVLAAPAIAGGRQLSPVLRAGGWTLGAFAPNRRFTGEGVVSLQPSDNIDAMRAASASPWHYADASGRELWGLVRVSDRAARAAARVKVPTLTLMGAKDEYIPRGAVEAVHRSIPGARAFVVYPEGWHWLFRDLQAPAVWNDVRDFALSAPASDVRP